MFTTNISECLLPIFKSNYFQYFRLYTINISEYLLPIFQSVYYQYFRVFTTNISECLLPIYHGVYYQYFIVFTTNISLYLLSIFQGWFNQFNHTRKLLNSLDASLNVTSPGVADTILLTALNTASIVERRLKQRTTLSTVTTGTLKRVLWYFEEGGVVL